MSIYIFGISAYYHDSAAALIKDGEIIAAAQEERFTRKKHDHGFPIHAMRYCMAEAGIAIDDVAHVVFYDKPFLKFERLLETYLMTAPLGICSFLKAMPLWLRKKLFLRETIAKELSYKKPLLFAAHHESHAASAFFPSPFNEAAILTVDGVGEWATLTIGKGTGHTLELIKEINFPHSVGLLYSAFTYYTGFRVNSGEYKLMGLAPYGEPRYVDLILEKLIDLKEDGSFRLDMRYFNYCAGLTMTNHRFHRLFGRPPRKPDTPLDTFYMDIARSIQVVTERIMSALAQHVYELTGLENLCLSGGVALNCVANGNLLKEGPFKRLWVQPAASDAGGALGAALAVWHTYLGNERYVVDTHADAQKASLLGPAFSTETIEEYLIAQDIPYEKLRDEEVIDRAVSILDDEKVLGWFQGRMEYGPRALGCRSILGDPRSERMQTTMNVKIKFRESFRPFAPSIMRDRVTDYFDFNAESPYMLFVSPLKEEKRIVVESGAEGMVGLDKLKVKRSVVPAITHVDYSARLQTVTAQDNPRYYALLKSFDKKTGCPLLINTSFNVRGEPIVCTPQDAVACFLRTNMDFLILENILLDKTKHKESTIALGDINEFPPD